MLTRKMVFGVLVTALVCWMGTVRAVESLWSLDDGIFASPEVWATPEGKSGAPEYKPGEIIVKFKKDVADSLEEQLRSGKRVGRLKLSASLDHLSRKYEVKKIEPLIKSFKADRQRIKSLKKKDKASLTKKEKHLLRRLRRAPKGAQVPDLGRIYRIEIGTGQSAPEAAAEYEQNPNVEYAELNHVYKVVKTPNDPNYSPELWSFNNTGQSYPIPGGGTASGTAGCDVNAPEAWDLSTGSSDVWVAVIDTGVNYNHRDLVRNMWTNLDDLPGDLNSDGRPGIANVDDDGDGLIDEDSNDLEPNDPNWCNDLVNDDDENGYNDDVFGYDFCTYGQTRDSDPMDDHGHGTHCSGTIAADSNNNIDIAGISWNSKIMAIRFLGSSGYGWPSDAVGSVYYGVDNGADVLSNSWGGGGYSSALEDAINYAHSQGVVVVAAAGNGNSSYPGYPASYDHVISVAATDSNDDKAYFSNYGEWVDLAAPGVDILSLHSERTDIYNDEQHFYPHKDQQASMYICSGTSMACPHVAGGCALLLSINGNLEPNDVNDILRSTGDPIDDGICASDGRLNLFRAALEAPTSQGYINLDKDYYNCDCKVHISLSDSDLSGSSTQDVNVTTSGGDSETVTLSEVSSNTGIYEGTISTESGNPNIGDGILQISDGETITGTYSDANDGTGSAASPNDTAAADCVGATISNVQFDAAPIGPELIVIFDTNELTTALVLCGANSVDPPEIVGSSPHLSLSHSVKMTGYSALTDYYFEIEVTDIAGNVTVDDNDANYYQFTTDAGARDMNVPSDYNTIQAAIDEAWDGATVWIADGNYTGTGNRDIDFKGKAITVRSVNGPNNCIIDCNADANNPHRGFYFGSFEGSDSVLQGLTIINGYAPEQVVANITWPVGGAVLTAWASPTITDCVFKENFAWCGGALLNNHTSMTVTDCEFTENSTDGFGGAIYNLYVGDANIGKCNFTENWSSSQVYLCQAGAVRSHLSNPILSECKFSKNSVSGAGTTLGGALVNVYSDLMVISNCQFEENSASGDSSGLGGAVFNLLASPTMLNCNIVGNSADTGGGIANSVYASPTFVGCTVASNSASKGAGMVNGVDSSPTVTNCIFWGNDPNEVDDYGEPNTTFSYCNIEASGGSDNWDPCLGNDGGGNIDEDPLFAEAEYGDLLDGTLAYWELNDGSGTTAVDTVGDFNGTLYGDPTWVGPLAGEYALDFDASGDGVYINGSSGTGSPLNIYDSNLTISAWAKRRGTGGTIVARAKPYYITYRLGISTDKAYINTYKLGPGHWILYTDSILDEDTWYHIVGVFDRGGDKGYVYVDGAKEAEGAMTTDPLSNDATTKIGCRNSTSDSPFNGVIDEVAIYDRLLTPKEIKRCYRNGLNGYGYFEVAYTDCHLKVESPCRNAGDPNGNYSGQTDIDGESRVLYGRVDIGADEVNNTIWYVDADGGSDSDDGSSWDDAFATIQKGIDSAIDGDIVEVNEGAYYESIDFKGKGITVRSIDPLDWSIVTSTVIDANGDDTAVDFHTSEGAESVLEGFKITGANRRGIRCRMTSPTIADCFITGNGSSSYEGGGMDNDESSPTVTNCVFNNNTAEIGGGMYNDEASPTVIGCVFYDNTAEYGGGMYNDYDSVVVVINCVFYNNEADYDGGGIYNDESSADIINCTFRYNEADSDDGGGVYNDDSDCNIINCIFWRNYASDDGDEIYNRYSTCTVSYCDIDDCGGSGAGWDASLGTDGGGNIEQDPDFENTSDRDGADNIWGTCDDGLRIKSTSPCKDAGQNSLVPQDINTDIKGSGRIINGTVDMGAYEYDPGC